MKRVIVLGSTGSVGRQSLEVIKELGYQVVGLGCGSDFDTLKKQMDAFLCKNAAIVNKNVDGLFCGENAFLDMCRKTDYDIIIVASSGLSALDCTLESLNNGKRVCLATKEIAVCAGRMLKKAAEKGELIPVDSEHSAIFQCLQAGKDIESITLTCSGGALRDVKLSDLPKMTAEDALRHPNWNMGDKITIDCATMANKALEVIEAAVLFGIEYDNINVLMHKESLTHGFITFVDGSILSQVSLPDMRSPIRYSLTYPDRSKTDSRLDLSGKTMTFDKVDDNRYPIFGTILDVCRNNEKASAFICGVDEGAVDLFLKGYIGYCDMHTIIKKAATVSPFGIVEDTQTAISLFNKGKEFAKELMVK